jgi:general L-amino acid transport system permease protein
VLKAMPAVKDSIKLPFDTFINQRGLFVPKPLPDPQFGFVYLAIAVGVVATIVLSAWAKRRLEATGKRFPVALSSIVLIGGLTAIVWLASGASVAFDPPVLNRFNFKGGLELPPELLAVMFGLTIYTAAFIAEIVRAGIKSVSSGQTEAAQSLGLKEGDRLRLVVIPQAMRVIVPPLTSQYLNLTKNSSLGAAIGYPELVNVFAGTTLNQSGRAIEVIALTMLVYLTFSLVTSGIMNWYNARVALVER